MAVFYRRANNGVTAVVPKEVYLHIQGCLEEVAKAGGWDKVNIPYPKPIFTFSDGPIQGSIRRSLVTGTYRDMDLVLAGHEVKKGDFYVPFSNKLEWGTDEQAERERAFHTTLGEALRAFGLARVA